ncbi:unnamed protein product [Parnassius apollo]|uniref:(apollo) hypothetical protein n=1 Tax=Parnassius apollo TaxID=110799 RepID=A0A8S3XMJ4_PARAO|nr:unnamed protein product [Parnassius apollo]
MPVIVSKKSADIKSKPIEEILSVPEQSTSSVSNKSADITRKPIEEILSVPEQSSSSEDNMAIDLYYTPSSAPCRVVLLVAAALNIQLNPHVVNLRGGEQLQPEFLKLNPQHTVPTIVDDGFSLWESRAISRYLVNTYGVDSSLYPTDPKVRALVDQRLDFDIGTLYPRFAEYFYPQIFAGASADKALHGKLQEGLKFLNTFLEGNKYAAGNELTLADLSLVATVSTIDAAGISLHEYPNVERWFELVKKTAPDYEEANGRGIQVFKAMVKNLLPRSEL